MYRAQAMNADQELRDTQQRLVTKMVIDDVTVVVLGTTPIVRGRTEAGGRVNGATVTARLRFTDVFVNRDGRWQAVASHASAISA
jgi:predicted ABC-type sugar transport system permease subunit